MSGTAPPSMGKIKMWTLQGNTLPAKAAVLLLHRRFQHRFIPFQSIIIQLKLFSWCLDECVRHGFRRGEPSFNKHLNVHSCCDRQLLQVSSSGGTLLAWWGNWDCERPWYASSNLSKISSSDFLRVDHQKEEISLGSVNTYQSIAFFRMMIPRYLGFSWNRGTPNHHPFIDGIFLIINQPAFLGYPQ